MQSWAATAANVVLRPRTSWGSGGIWSCQHAARGSRESSRRVEESAIVRRHAERKPIRSCVPRAHETAPCSLDKGWTGVQDLAASSRRTETLRQVNWTRLDTCPLVSSDWCARKALGHGRSARTRLRQGELLEVARRNGWSSKPLRSLAFAVPRSVRGGRRSTPDASVPTRTHTHTHDPRSSASSCPQPPACPHLARSAHTSAMSAASDFGSAHGRATQAQPASQARHAKS